MITRENKTRLIALCPGHTTERGAMDEALLALWAIQVLDAWGAKHKRGGAPSPYLWRGKYLLPIVAYSVDGLDFPGREFTSVHSLDDVRVNAARDLVIEDPTLDPCS